jgi:ribonuclease E
MSSSQKKGRRKLFISVLPGEQVEVSLAEEGSVQEYYVEMVHQAKTKGNIYKGTINNIDTNLQAAFVNYGAEKNGFLQIDEVHPEYYSSPHDPNKGRKYPLIQKVLKAGMEVLVQVVKEPTGTKGAFLTSYLSLPGRFLVLTPGRDQIGVSRKVEDDKERQRLKKLLEGLDPGENLGVIVRTVSVDQPKTAMQRDLSFLKRLWKDVRKKATTEPSPSLIYQERDLATRSIRDYLTDDVTEVWVDDENTAKAVEEFASLVFPRRGLQVRLHTAPEISLWERFNLQKQIEQIYSREVTMPSGGRLVFDQTEALMAVDINSGKIAGKTNFESMALKTNTEAAVTIAQQLKLRDIGGQVVIDFIEMRDRNHWREVEKTLRQAMKNDRARHDVGKMSRFGLLQVVRQRLGSSALSISSELCPCCGGSGTRRNMEWQALQALKDILQKLTHSKPTGPLRYECNSELALYLLNHKRERLFEMEQKYDLRIEVTPKKD